MKNCKGEIKKNFAEIIDTDQRQLTKIEAGESFAAAETIECTSKKLRISAAVLFNMRHSKDDKMTLEVIARYDKNLKDLVKAIKKAVLDLNKVKFLLSACAGIGR